MKTKSVCVALVVTMVVLLSQWYTASASDQIDGRVVQVTLPHSDIQVVYLEARGGMSLELTAGGVKVIAPKIYVGDGKVAIPLEAHGTDGIFLEGSKSVNSGHVFKQYSVVEINAEHKLASDLQPGDIYIEFPTVNFKVKK